MQDYTFERYQVILDRQPFGEIKAPTGPPGGGIPVVPPFVKDIKMCAITEDEDGIQVGFVNVAQKPPKSYYLRIGESEDSIVLVDADYGREVALLRKGEEQHWVSMEGPVIGDPETAAAASASVVSIPKSNKPPAAARPSYAERLRRRREAVRVREAPEPVLKGEELKKHLEEYQMELIRTGMPPLPMQLTPEMDAKLVEEGVLPPADAEAVSEPVQ